MPIINSGVFQTIQTENLHSLVSGEKIPISYCIQGNRSNLKCLFLCKYY